MGLINGVLNSQSRRLLVSRSSIWSTTSQKSDLTFPPHSTTTLPSRPSDWLYLLLPACHWPSWLVSHHPSRFHLHTLTVNLANKDLRRAAFPNRLHDFNISQFLYLIFLFGTLFPPPLPSPRHEFCFVLWSAHTQTHTHRAPSITVHLIDDSFFYSVLRIDYFCREVFKNNRILTE